MTAIAEGIIAKQTAIVPLTRTEIQLLLNDNNKYLSDKSTRENSKINKLYTSIVSAK